MSISTLDIAWLAGLVEGEGCFRLQHRSINIMVGMTDEDVIAKAAKLLGRHYLNVPPREERCKPQFHITFSGRHAAAWMMTLYPFMGQRRRERIRKCIAHWMSRPNSKYMENTVCGHTHLPLGARGLCDTCYDRQRPKKKTSPEVRHRYYQKNSSKIRARQKAYIARKKAINEGVGV